MHFNSVLFAGAIRQKRAADKSGLREVVDLTGISPSTLSRLENGKDHDISMTTFTTLCNWLQLDPGAFFVAGTEATPVITTIEQIEILLRAEGSPFCKAVAEVMRISRERGK